jgi:hypothetical protein
MTAVDDEPAGPRGPQDDAAMPKAATKYRIYLDEVQVELLLERVGDIPDDWPFPQLAEVHPSDLLFLGEMDGHTRGVAVDKLLDLEPGTSYVVHEPRLAVVRAAEQAGHPILFRIVPLNYIGEIPVATEVKRSRSVG